MKKRFKKGFTLIELLIVIAIIGILTVALLPSILSAPASARDAGKKSKVHDIVVALEQYHSDHSAYPAAASCLDGTADTTETALASYMKSAFGLPEVQVSITATELGVAASCGAYYYCPLAGSRYFVGIGMEKQGFGSNSGYYQDITPATVCSGTKPETDIVTEDTTATFLWGAKQ